MTKTAHLFLIPTAINLDDSPHPQVRETLPQIEIFICERIRTTRRWLRSVLPDYDIDSRTFLEYDKHKNTYPWSEINRAWKEGKICGLTSEAGTPAVADPGFQVVALAHRRSIPVIPLPGNNSLILALMASGLNGNQFTYHGYFPVKEKELRRLINYLTPAIQQGYTQMFIETPYRNVKTMKTLMRLLSPDLSLSVSSSLLSTNSRSQTKTIRKWQKCDLQYLNKIPAVFVIGKIQ